MVADQQSNFEKKKKKRESLCKIYNSTLCWSSISLSSFLKYLKDGLKLGSSFQHFFIMSYLKGRQKKFNKKQAFSSKISILS